MLKRLMQFQARYALFNMDDEKYKGRPNSPRYDAPAFSRSRPERAELMSRYTAAPMSRLGCETATARYVGCIGYLYEFLPYLNKILPYACPCLYQYMHVKRRKYTDFMPRSNANPSRNDTPTLRGIVFHHDTCLFFSLFKNPQRPLPCGQLLQSL